MHTYLLCALLTMHQTSATCWQVITPEPSCDRLMALWLDDAGEWYVRNPDVVPMPQVSCGVDSALPPGARMIARVKVGREKR